MIENFNFIIMLKSFTLFLFLFECSIAGRPNGKVQYLYKKKLQPTSHTGYVYERPDQKIVPQKAVHQRVSEIACTRGNFHKVVGGEKTTPGEFPHMAALGWRTSTGRYDYKCGGTLISRTFVLTAAHCISSKNKRPDVVLLGGVRLHDPSNDKNNINIANVFVHPNYKRKEVYNDIALIQLANGTGNLPACLWPKQKITVGRATVIGYGQTQFGSDTSNDLLKADINIFSDDFCRQFYTPGYRLRFGFVNTQFCAGDLNRQRDTCPGDSGGPLLTNINTLRANAPYVLGVTSFGQACALGSPGVYTKVAAYLDWIESIVWP